MGGTDRGTEDALLITQEEVEKYIRLLMQEPYPRRTKVQDMVPVEFLAKALLYATELNRIRPMLLEMNCPMATTVVGDLHGSINDLLYTFYESGPPPDTNYLFLGDYVGRGPNQMEVIILLVLLQLRWPRYFHLLRGNHESFETSTYDKFYDVCADAYDNWQLFCLFSQFFDYLPIAAIINDSIFCCHGGVSQWMTSRDAIKNIKRPTVLHSLSVLQACLFNDILWADPVREQETPFAVNTMRGAYSFNADGLLYALAHLKCSTLIRGHQDLGGVYQNFEHCYTVHTKDSQSNTVIRAAYITIYTDRNTGHMTINALRSPSDSVPVSEPTLLITMQLLYQFIMALSKVSSMEYMKNLKPRNLLKHWAVVGVAEVHFVTPEHMRDWMVVFAANELEHLDEFRRGGRGFTMASFPTYFPLIYDTVKGVTGSYRNYISPVEKEFINKMSLYKPKLGQPVPAAEWPQEGFDCKNRNEQEILSEIRASRTVWD